MDTNRHLTLKTCDILQEKLLHNKICAISFYRKVKSQTSETDIWLLRTTHFNSCKLVGTSSNV